MTTNDGEPVRFVGSMADLLAGYAAANPPKPRLRWRHSTGADWIVYNTARAGTVILCASRYTEEALRRMLA